MQRTAQCQCGAVKAQTDGEPQAVVACSCGWCQRRSGSAIGVGAYFEREKVKVSGRPVEFVRPGGSGKALRTYFCSQCGTSVYWLSDRDPQLIGVAVGAFSDPTFPKPARSVFEETKHAWLVLSPEIPGHMQGRNSPLTRQVTTQTNGSSTCLLLGEEPAKAT
jgi:hypothetical protein